MTEPRVWDGAPITEPGIYTAIPLADYHKQLTDTPSVSSSGLRTIEAESPLHYWHSSYMNPDRPAPEYVPHFALGSAVHTLMLGEDGFRDQYVVRPPEFRDWRGKDAQGWRDGMLALGKTVLVPEDLAAIRGIAQRLNAEPLIRDGLFGGLVESSLCWRDAETGVWLKARPDTLNPAADLIADLKTTKSADGQSCRRSITDFGYHVQLALAAEGYEVLYGREIPNDCFILVFAETKAPYAINIKPVDAEAVWYGRRQIRRAVRIFAECLNRNEWPGYADSGITAHLMPWYEQRLKREAETGELPEFKPGKAA